MQRQPSEVYQRTTMAQACNLGYKIGVFTSIKYKAGSDSYTTQRKQHASGKEGTNFKILSVLSPLNKLPSSAFMGGGCLGSLLLLFLTLSPSPPLLTLSFQPLLRPISPLRRLALLASLEALSASFEALCSGFPAFLSNNCIDSSLSVNPPFIGFLGGSFILFPNIFSFDFFKIRSKHFGTPSPSTSLSTVFLGVATFVCRLNLRHPPSTRQSVSYTRLRVDLTRRRVLSTRHPLQCCGAASPPHPPPSQAFLHHSMHCFSLYWALYFEFMWFFSVFFGVPSTFCNYLFSMVRGGLWNCYGSVILLGSFG
jgi:hypothetical protein